MRSMMDYLLFGFVWITPVFLALVIRMQLRRRISAMSRAVLWVAYLLWAALWAYLWVMFTPQSATPTTQERIYIMGVLITAAIGIVIMLSGEVARWTSRDGGHNGEEDRNPG